MSEVEIGREVVRWFEDQHWDVYQEVAFRHGRTVDIVAKLGPVLWAVECKVNFGLAVLGQAHEMIPMAHRVSVACLPSKRGSNPLRRKMLGALGIGLFTVVCDSVHNDFPPAFRRRVLPDLGARLNENQRTYAPAGNDRSLRWSPWKQTCDNVEQYVAANPGCAPAACLREIAHHYTTEATARTSMVTWVRLGKLGGVEQRRNGHRLEWWPKGGGA